MQESSFRAVKNLIQAQRNIQTIKNRIKVLQKNEQKNINKINLQKQQIQKITMVKNQHLEELRKMKVTKMERERMIEQMKAKNQQWRKDHLDKLETVKAEIFEEKAKDYTQTVQQRSLNQSRILQNKSSMLQKKQQTRNNVVLLQQKSRQNILKFYEDKTSSIHAKTNLQISKINKTREKKQKQLSDFSAVEMEMIERHSQSQVAYKQMKSKLDAMLGRIRLEKRKGIKQMKSSVHRQGKENLYTLDGA